MEETVKEIMRTDKSIKNYTQKLNVIETLQIAENINKDMMDEFKNIMVILEEKTEYLYKLKKQYNKLYKKLNNIN